MKYISSPQDYILRNSGPAITENIYTNSRFSMINLSALATYQSGQNYDAGYQVTARFLLWIENKVKTDFVKLADQQLRLHTFTDETWKQLTGKTLAELWTAYTSNPAL